MGAPQLAVLLAFSISLAGCSAQSTQTENVKERDAESPEARIMRPRVRVDESFKLPVGAKVGIVINQSTLTYPKESVRQDQRPIHTRTEFAKCVIGTLIVGAPLCYAMGLMVDGINSAETAIIQAAERADTENQTSKAFPALRPLVERVQYFAKEAGSIELVALPPAGERRSISEQTRPVSAVDYVFKLEPLQLRRDTVYRQLQIVARMRLIRLSDSAVVDRFETWRHIESLSAPSSLPEEDEHVSRELDRELDALARNLVTWIRSVVRTES